MNLLILFVIGILPLLDISSATSTKECFHDFGKCIAKPFKDVYNKMKGGGKKAASHVPDPKTVKHPEKIPPIAHETIDEFKMTHESLVKPDQMTHESFVKPDSSEERMTRDSFGQMEYFSRSIGIAPDKMKHVKLVKPDDNNSKSGKIAPESFVKIDKMTHESFVKPDDIGSNSKSGRMTHDSFVKPETDSQKTGRGVQDGPAKTENITFKYGRIMDDNLVKPDWFVRNQTKPFQLKHDSLVKPDSELRSNNTKPFKMKHESLVPKLRPGIKRLDRIPTNSRNGDNRLSKPFKKPPIPAIEKPTDNTIAIVDSKPSNENVTKATYEGLSAPQSVTPEKSNPPVDTKPSVENIDKPKDNEISTTPTAKPDIANPTTTEISKPPEIETQANTEISKSKDNETTEKQPVLLQPALDDHEPGIKPIGDLNVTIQQSGDKIEDQKPLNPKNFGMENMTSIIKPEEEIRTLATED